MTPVMIISIVVAVVVLAPVVAIVAGGARVKRTVLCPAHEWTPIVKNFGTGLPRSITVELHSADAGTGTTKGEDTDAEAGEDAEDTPDGAVGSDEGTATNARVPGRWREVRQRRLVKDESVAGDLASSMTFHRRWIDWRYRIEVRPDEDLTAIVS